MDKFFKTLNRHYEAFKVQLKNNFVREAIYRTNFMTSLATDVVWMCVEMALFKVIYSNVPVLGGWTAPQVYFFLGVFFSSDALFTIFFQRNFWNFSDLVNKGELDILLTKPVHPLFLALTRWINISAVFNFILGISITIYFADAAGFAGGIAWAFVPLWLLVGVAAATVLRFSFCVWTFWTERSWALSILYYQFFSFATKPDPIYPNWIRYVILTVLPFAFIGSVPARALLKGLSATEVIWIFGVLGGFLLLNSFLWKKGLKRYQSASS